MVLMHVVVDIELLEWFNALPILYFQVYEVSYKISETKEDA